MRETEVFSAVVGDIYDASLDPTLWPSVCEKTCAFIGASAAGLMWQDTLRKAAHFISPGALILTFHRPIAKRTAN
jgi:hypothetical protein